MFKRTLIALSTLVCAAGITGCVTNALLPDGGGATTGRGAAIIGTVSASGATGKALAWSSSTDCPEVTVMLNGSPADIVFDDDCSFVIENVAPADSVELHVAISSLGISGTVELKTVTDAELIEIAVEVGDDSLAISVERRAKPAPGDQLPEVIDGNNVTIELPAGTFTQSLTVNGNNFALTGVAGDGCDAEGWTVIDGSVAVNGNNAKFRNVKFIGTVEVKANNTKFINCCFDGVLVTFGKGNGHHGDDENDGDNNDGEKDDGNNDDTGNHDDGKHDK
jgi:hypothetical protein